MIHKTQTLLLCFLKQLLYKLDSLPLVVEQGSEMGVRGDRATGCAAGTDLYEGNTSPFQVVMYRQ